MSFGVFFVVFKNSKKNLRYPWHKISEYLLLLCLFQTVTVLTFANALDGFRYRMLENKENNR